MKFKIEQIAISLPAKADPEPTKTLLEAIGAKFTASDVVTAKGYVMHNGLNRLNVASLDFDYELSDNVEFEVLQYHLGDNWMQRHHGPRHNHSALVSHLGTHVTEEELASWRDFFEARKIAVAQEVDTLSHRNPLVPKGRRYRYAIFDTRELLGLDLKFIVRLGD